MKEFVDVIEEIYVPEEVLAYVERLEYEMQGYKDIVLSTLYKSDDVVYNVAIYDRLMNEFQMARAAYNLALDELKRTYASAYIDRADVVMNIFYAQGKIQIKKMAKDGCGKRCSQ